MEAQVTIVEVSVIEVGVILAAIVVLLMLSAFFNASETALTAASRARMHALEQEGNSKARLVNRLLRQPEKLIGAVLLGNTLVDILAASLASGLAVVMVGPAGVAYATGDHDAADRRLLRGAAQDLRAGLRRPRGAVRGADHARDDRPAQPAHRRRSSSSSA